MQVNVQFLQQLQPEWSRFVTVVKQRQEIDKVLISQAGQNLKDRMQPSYMQSLPHDQVRSTDTNAKRSSNQLLLNHESGGWNFKKLYKPTNNNLRTSSNSKNKTEDTTPRYHNDNQSGQFGNQRTMTVAGARETVGSPYATTRIHALTAKDLDTMHGMQEAKSVFKTTRINKEKMMIVQTKLEQVTWQRFRRSHLKNPVLLVSHWNKVVQKDDSNVIPDSSNICTNDNQVDQNAAECVDERAALANLIANLTLDTEENKTVLKQLKKANASLTQELEECKTNLDETSRALGEATSSRDSSLIALQTKQTELEKYTALNDPNDD
ncbi:hypothetical protein Tco_0047913 [Tanacetum coccineum]